MAGHGAKCLVPARARMACRADDEGIALDDDLDVVPQAGLFDQGLRDANASRVADTDDTRLHQWSPRGCGHNVITSSDPVKEQPYPPSSPIQLCRAPPRPV